MILFSSIFTEVLEYPYDLKDDIEIQALVSYCDWRTFFVLSTLLRFEGAILISGSCQKNVHIVLFNSLNNGSFKIENC